MTKIVAPPAMLRRTLTTCGQPVVFRPLVDQQPGHTYSSPNPAKLLRHHS
jgi:hypothetical protein